jgi:hypothetical protein
MNIEQERLHGFGSYLYLSNSFKRSEHFFRRRISPFKNGIIQLEAGAFKFLRNRLFMTSMQLPRKRDVPFRKCRARYRHVAKTTCGMRRSNYLPLLLYRIALRDFASFHSLLHQ